MLKVFVSEKRNDGGDGGLRDSFLLAPVSEILLDITAKSSPALTREISQILFDSGLVKKGTFSILKKIMEAELNRLEFTVCMYKILVHTRMDVA